MKQAESVILESYRIAINNAEIDEQIKTELAKHGYTDERLAEGKDMLEEAFQLQYKKVYLNSQESDLYDRFLELWKKMDITYMGHRTKAKLIFEEDDGMQERLMIQGKMPENYYDWLKYVSNFYKNLSRRPELLKPMARFGVTEETISQASAQLDELMAVRSEYIRIKGNDEDATNEKKAVIERIKQWMSEFYAVARIAFRDHPQLIESLMKVKPS